MPCRRKLCVYSSNICSIMLHCSPMVCQMGQPQHNGSVMDYTSTGRTIESTVLVDLNTLPHDSSIQPSIRNCGLKAKTNHMIKMGLKHDLYHVLNYLSCRNFFYHLDQFFYQLAYLQTNGDIQQILITNALIIETQEDQLYFLDQITELKRFAINFKSSIGHQT